MYKSAYALWKRLLKKRKTGLKLLKIYHYDVAVNSPSHYHSYDVSLAACISGDLSLVLDAYRIGYSPSNNFVIKAGEYGKLNVVKFLCSIGCDPTVYSNSAIRYASIGGHLRIIKWLYRIGCNVSFDNDTLIRDACMMYAIQNGHLPLVKWLCSIGCTLAKNAVLDACTLGHLDMVKWLYSIGHGLKSGLDIESAKVIAHRYGYYEIALFLHEKHP